jgi:hypothetical protein
MSLANVYQYTSVSSTKLPFDVWTVGDTITSTDIPIRFKNILSSHTSLFLAEGA